MAARKTKITDDLSKFSGKTFKVNYFDLNFLKGSINEQQKIVKEDDLIELKQEFRQKSLREMLVASHDLNRKESFKSI